MVPNSLALWTEQNLSFESDGTSHDFDSRFLEELRIWLESTGDLSHCCGVARKHAMMALLRPTWWGRGCYIEVDVPHVCCAVHY